MKKLQWNIQTGCCSSDVMYVLPGFNYSEELMTSVREVGDLYFFNTRTGAFISAFTEAIEELQTLDQQDKANAERAVESIRELEDIGVKSITLGYKVYRTARRIAALTPLIAADGPLPIGDIVFVGLAIVEVGLLAYDLGTDIYDWVSDL